MGRVERWARVRRVANAGAAEANKDAKAMHNGGNRTTAMELAVAEAFGDGWTPWKLLARLDRLGRTVVKRDRPRCGAHTRSGRPCRAPAVWDRRRNRARNGRCRLHGGLSTGPKTAEGKARIAEANRRRARRADWSAEGG